MTLVSNRIFFESTYLPKISSGSVKLDEISIVIPVKNNQEGIERYLNKFFEVHNSQHYPLEIIIVDNNSTPAIHIPQKYQLNDIVKLTTCLKPGPAAARNRGVAIAKGSWLLFNDSDCLPTQSFISGYINAQNTSVAYAGNVLALGNDRLSMYYQSQEILLPLKAPANHDQPQYLITANSLIWKKAFIEAGGFNEEIKIAGGEDIDLGLRLSKIGNLSYALESAVLHDFNDGFIGFYKRFKRYGYGNRILQEIYGVDMLPRLFRPNVKTPFNTAMSRLQYLSLLFGYMRASVDLRKGMIKRSSAK